MTKWLKIGSIITLITIISVLALGTLALAQNPDTPGRGGPRLEKLAEKLGLTADELQAALDSGKTIEELAAEKGVTLPARPEGLGGKGDETRGNIKTVVAELLGMTTAELETARQNGQTIADLLEAKGLTKQDLAKAVYDAALEQLTAAVTDGKLTQTQANKMKERLTERYENCVNDDNCGPVERDYPERFPVMKDVLTELLGMTPAELLKAHQNGQTITDLLEAKGLTQQDLAKARYDAALEQLTAAVTDGKLTQTQADKMKERLTERYENCVNNNQCGPEGGMRPPRR